MTTAPWASTCGFLLPVATFADLAQQAGVNLSRARVRTELSLHYSIITVNRIHDTYASESVIQRQSAALERIGCLP